MGIRFNALHVGDTWSFTVDGGEYDPATWTLTLWLVPRFTTPVQSVVQITSAVDGDLHLFAQPAAVTATYAAGSYGYYTTATDGTDRFTLDASEWSGEVDILADPATLAQGHDGRSGAQRALDLAKAAYYAYSSGSVHVLEYEINGRRMKYGSPAAILEHISALEADVARERRAEAIRRGLADPRKVYVRTYRA
jgi:hypothetical protein